MLYQSISNLKALFAHELHESIEQPGLWRAQSGRFAANASCPGCSSYGLRSTSSNSEIML
jgi:hypothetical protein